MRHLVVFLILCLFSFSAHAVPCGNITYAGCCTSDGVIKYCENGQLKEMDCKKNGPPNEKVCGWDAEYGFYNCGYIGADPSGTYPYLCPGETCKPKCDGKECGSDECGGECGKCPEGTVCGANFKCDGKPCGKVPFQGCCDGNTVVWCEYNFLHFSKCDTKPCGWKGGPGDGIYECGYSGSDPSGMFPKSCEYWGYNVTNPPDTSEGKVDGTEISSETTVMPDETLQNAETTPDYTEMASNQGRPQNENTTVSPPKRSSGGCQSHTGSQVWMIPLYLAIIILAWKIRKFI